MKKYVSVQFKGTECSRNSPYEVRSAEKKSSFPEQKSCQHNYIVAVSCDQVLSYTRWGLVWHYHMTSANVANRIKLPYTTTYSVSCSWPSAWQSSSWKRTCNDLYPWNLFQSLSLLNIYSNSWSARDCLRLSLTGILIGLTSRWNAHIVQPNLTGCKREVTIILRPLSDV